MGGGGRTWASSFSCHNTIRPPGRSTQTPVFAQSWRLDVEDPGAVRAGSGRPLPAPAVCPPLTQTERSDVSLVHQSQRAGSHARDPI